MTVESFTDALHRFKREKGMNTSQLARKLQVRRESVWRWENGRTMPSYKNLQKLERLGLRLK